MIISASQLDTYHDCNRHWWFRRVLRLPEPPASHFTFGTVLHAVIERWLKATDTGRDPKTSEPVNLYPAGWTVATEMDGSKAEITPTEAAHIKRLVAEAIESGVLVREAGTQVEREIRIPVREGVQLMGYVDIFRSCSDVRPLPLIEDNKSYGKGSVRYLKKADRDSPHYLGANQQLLTYAYATSQLDGYTGDVVLRHNQYPKFEGREVTQVEAVVTAEQIELHGAYLRSEAGRMQLTARVKKWEDVPGPEDLGKCSHWYGKACPFSDICGHVENPEVYQARVARLLEQRSGKARLDLPLEAPRKRGRKQEAATVSIFDRANRQQKARTAQQEAAGTAEARAAVQEAPAINGGTPPAEPAPATGGAPWADPTCRACKGRGISAKGKGCPICDAKAKRAGRPTSMAYVLELDEDGRGVAVGRPEELEALEAAGMPEQWIEGEQVSQEPVKPLAPVQDPLRAAGAETKKALAILVPKAADPEPPFDTKVMDPAKRAVVETLVEQARAPEAKLPAAPAPKTGNKGGRPPVGLTLMIGVTQIRGVSRPTLTSAEVLARFGAELAADMGAESYWVLDTFKRRERLAQKADYIAQQLGRTVIVHPGVLGNDDAGSLVQALMGLSEGVDSVLVRIS